MGSWSKKGNNQNLDLCLTFFLIRFVFDLIAKVMQQVLLILFLCLLNNYVTLKITIELVIDHY